MRRPSSWRRTAIANGNPGGRRWLLQGLLVCRHCGYALYGLGTRHRLANGNTVEHSYYRCTGRNGNRFGGQRLCENRQVRVDDLDEAVWKDVCQLLREPAKVQAEYQRRVGEGSGKKQSFVEDQLGRQLTKARSSLARLIDSYQEGLLEKDEFEPRLRATRERLARWKPSPRRSRSSATRTARCGWLYKVSRTSGSGYKPA